MENEDDLLKISEAAKLIKVSNITMKRYISKGIIPSIKIGGIRRISKADLYINSPQFTTNNSLKINQENLDKNGHFYWSQKKASIANQIYREKCKEGEIIMDPFLGAGSSLYGISGTKLKFIGVELNEQPIKIAEFNIKKKNSDFYIKLRNSIKKMEDKYGEIYKYQSKDGNQLTFEKVIYDNDKDSLKIQKIFFTDSNGIKTDSETYPETKEEFIKRYLEYKSNIDSYENIKLIKNSRIAIKDNMFISDIFSPINFCLLNNIKKEIEGNEDLKFLLGAVLHLCKLTDIKSQSQFPYWIPKKGILDRNIFNLLNKKNKQLETNQEDFEIKNNKNFNELKNNDLSSCLLLNMPAQEISKKIPEKSIDFVLTDPPYFDQVAYSEYLKIWEFFLNYKSFLKNEIIVSQREEEKSNLERYINNLKKVFFEIYKVLKNNKEVWIYFKDSRLDKMGLFLDLVTSCGFDFLGQRYITANKYTYKQNTTIKSTIKGESILIFKKNKGNIKTKNDHKDIPEINEIIQNYVIKYLEIKKSASLGNIVNDGLIKLLYDNKALFILNKSKELVNIIEEVTIFDPKKREYFLKK